MRKVLALAAMLALGYPPFGFGGAAKKKSTVTKSTSSGKTAATKKGKKPTRRATWRDRQLTPTPERYKQIQEALCARGYLTSDQVTGRWTDTSAAALKKFQADQNLQASGKIDSLSLIALGLGPKHSAAKKPAPPPATP